MFKIFGPGLVSISPWVISNNAIKKTNLKLGF